MTVTQLEVYVDTDATLAGFGFARGLGDILKHPADLERYAKIIRETGPEVLVECGTRTGDSARWFAAHGVRVLTIDIRQRAPYITTQGIAESSVEAIVGDTATEYTAQAARTWVAGRRCMVSLDSDHSAAHVAREIELFGPLVSAGCYLVVEDGIFRYANPATWRRYHFGDPTQGNPLDAIEACLLDRPQWRRDVDIERLHPVSHHPGGWWVRTEVP